MKYIAEQAVRFQAKYLARLARRYRAEAAAFAAAGARASAAEERRIAFAYREAFRSVLSVLKNCTLTREEVA